MFKKRKKSCFSRILSLFFAGAGFLAALTVSSGLKQLRKKRRKKLKLLFWNLIVLSIAVPLTSVPLLRERSDMPIPSRDHLLIKD